MQTVLITGGSRGIGAACVRRFAQNGDRVFFCYEKSEASARALAAQTGATAVRADVACEADVAALFAAAGPVDTLVLCAGISHYGLVSEITTEEWDRLFAVNVRGAHLCARAALPGMLQKQAGSIVTVSSMWGQVGASCEAAYSAAKGALIAYTKALAKELGPSGIRVNCVAPGCVDTDMMAEFDADDRAALCEETPLGRIADASEIAEAIFQLSRLPFTTGQILGVNGGFVI